MKPSFMMLCSMVAGSKRRALAALAVSLLALGWTAPASAQGAAAFPSRAVRLMVPFAAGGSPDVIARELGNALGALWGQTVVIENRGGAGGIIGADAVAKAAPDGYTILLGSDSTMVNASFFQEKMPYDALRDFVPIGMIAGFPLVLVSNPASAYKTLAQLVAAAKAAPGTISYATVGAGSSHHLSMEILSQFAGLKLIHVPYKGGAPALQDLLAGHLPVMFSGLATAMPFIRANKLNVLAISSAERFFLMPDVPTVAEQGYPGFEVTNWIGILAPAGTPPAIVAKIEADLAKVTRSESYRTRLAKDGVEALTRTSEVFGKRIRSDMEKNGAVLRAAGVIK